MKNDEHEIVILGAGESGIGAALLAKKKEKSVFVSDSSSIETKYKNVLLNHGISFEEEKHSLDRILLASSIIVSPGIPLNISVLQKARTKSIPIISEIEFASHYSKGKIIMVTGSNGKTTTASLLHDMLLKGKMDSCLAGNIGNSFAKELSIKDHEVFVLEISSFQLDTMFHARADIALLLNITPDHLDRYENSFEKYVASKFRVLQNQRTSDAFIFNFDDESILDHLKDLRFDSKKFPFSLQKNTIAQGAYINNNELVINTDIANFNMTLEQLALQGKHNLYNSMAAATAASLLRVKKQAIRDSLANFHTLEHRLEFVANVHGMKFINDSKATNVNSTWFALESQTNPIVWIAGGVDKGNNYKLLLELVKKKVKAIVCIGENNTKLYKEFADIVPTIISASSMSDATQAAYYLGEKGDVILLSPACSSFDLFKNFEDRGRKFKAAVKEL